MVKSHADWDVSFIGGGIAKFETVLSESDWLLLSQQRTCSKLVKKDS
ncbi:hypothetical protein [Vibrio proteolyticus]|nr:hypothetical protein [Vibrio proteolyticus]